MVTLKFKEMIIPYHLQELDIVVLQLWLVTQQFKNYLKFLKKLKINLMLGKKNMEKNT
jgi:hypothetical protein